MNVTVIGGGLSGLAASIHLAKAGFAVKCFEAVREFDHILGESLDWSAPELLRQLELGMEDLICREVSTFKRHVIMKLSDGSTAEYVPSPWLARPPLNIELRTLHVDRNRLHQDLMRLAAENGVEVVHDRVLAVERNDETISHLQAESGERIASRWFVDASGASASVFGREFRLPSIEYGPRKVAMWTYLDISERQEGTTLYASGAEGEYMEWIWEIPIRPGVVSIGFVCTGAEMKRRRAQGLAVEEIFRRQLQKFARFREWLGDAKLPKVQTTAFTCRVFQKVCGPNWIIIGEAASLPDPITGNGVTAALRQAAEASRLLCRYRNKPALPFWARAIYNLRVTQMGKFFNSLIEKLAYRWPIRDRMGLLKAGEAYTIPAWSINHLYSRIRPEGLVSTALFCAFLGLLRGVASACYFLCKRFPDAGRSLSELTS